VALCAIVFPVVTFADPHRVAVPPGALLWEPVCFAEVDRGMVSFPSAPTAVSVPHPALLRVLVATPPPTTGDVSDPKVLSRHYAGVPPRCPVGRVSFPVGDTSLLSARSVF